MRSLARILPVLLICTWSYQAQAKETFLLCDGFYNTQNNLVKITKNWIGKRKVLIQPEGNWQEVKLIESDDAHVYFYDGWGHENSKDCKDEKFNKETFCSVNKEIMFQVKTYSGNKLVVTNYFSNSDCCIAGKPYKAGAFVKSHYCTVTESVGE